MSIASSEDARTSVLGNPFVHDGCHNLGVFGWLVKESKGKRHGSALRLIVSLLGLQSSPPSGWR